MSVWSNIKGTIQNLKPKAAETDQNDNLWYWFWVNEACKAMYAPDGEIKFSNDNAYQLASTVSELFFPIDAVADRVASLKFDIVNNNGDIAEPPKNIKRLLDSPNPFSSFSEMIYNSVFYELSDGNNYIYTKTPKSLKGISPDTISSVWLLQPDKVEIKIKNARPNYFDITKPSDIIDYYNYSKYDKEHIDPRYIIHERSLPLMDYRDELKSPSPLNAAERNINNLLVVYQARYKVYAHNGNAGILTRDASGNNGSVENAVDPVTRDMIIKDITDRNGLIADKRLWTVSAVPLKFLKTLGTISELQPFEETQADSLQVAGIYGVDKDLLPLKEGTTFTNKAQAEKGLYQNVIKGVAENKAESFTKAFGLNQIGLSFKPNYEDVAVLQTDIETSLNGDSILIENIIKLKDAGLINESDLNDISFKITERYKNG